MLREDEDNIVPPGSSNSATSAEQRCSVDSQELRDISAARRISGWSPKRARASTAEELIDEAHLHQYDPLYTLERHHCESDVVDLDAQESGSLLSEWQLQKEESSQVAAAMDILFFSRKKSFLGLFNLRTGLSIFSIFQIVVSFFSFEFFLIAAESPNFDVKRETPGKARLYQAILWWEVFQNHIIVQDPTDLIKTFHRNSALIAFRIAFSWMSAVNALSLIRCYRESVAFVVTGLLGFELCGSIGVFIARIVAVVTNATPGSSSLFIFYFSSSIICMIYSWTYLAIQLSFCHQEHGLLLYLARRFPQHYGPLFYQLEEEEKPDSPLIKHRRRSSDQSSASAKSVMQILTRLPEPRRLRGKEVKEEFLEEQAKHSDR